MTQGKKMRIGNYISIGAAILVFTSVATALHFGNLPLGLGELIVIPLFLWALQKKDVIYYLKHPIMLFWMSFIAIAGIAASLNTLSTVAALHTALAFLYAACFSVTSIVLLEQISNHNFKKFIKALTTVPAVLLAIPFLCLLTDSHKLATWLAINTDYPSRLSAWSTNPNQLALFLLPIPIWLMAIYRESNWQGIRWLFNFFLLWAFFLIGICVRSDALLLAWSTGLPTLSILASLWIKPLNLKIPGTVLVAFILAFSSFKLVIDGPVRNVVIKADSITKIEDPNPALIAVPSKSDSLLGVGLDPNKGSVRKTLWVHAYEAWLKSPIIGHGPGAFSYLDDPATKEEAHNLGLDMLTQVGAVGVSLFGALYLWLLISAYKARDPYSLTVLIVLMVFSAAHFTLRQPVFSLYMIICALAVKRAIFTGSSEKPQLSD